MNLSLFSTLLRNLLHANILHLKDDRNELLRFEEKYCLHPSLQPMYTAEALSYLLESMHENTFYEIVDTLQICILFFRFADQTFFVGPYVKNIYEEEKMQAVLVENQMPASYKLSLKLYYNTFPLLSVFHIQNTITACINAFTDGSREYSYHRLHGFQEKMDSRPLFEMEALDYDELYRRYDVENHFLKMIETGNTEAVLTAYSEMVMSPESTHKMIDSAVYQNPAISLSIVRALARKAAEQGCASVIDINEITQRTVQKIASSQNYLEQSHFTRTMICELTEAVRMHRLHYGAYTPPIQRIVEYLDLNYSQEISYTHLADIAHFSEAHLSKIFKKETGTTITQYIIQLRCQKAAQMLKETHLSVQEISSFVGYLDNNYFVKIFKKQYGLTPTAFRTQHQEAGGQ